MAAQKHRPVQLMSAATLSLYIAGLRESVRIWPALHGESRPSWLGDALREAEDEQKLRGEQLALKF